MAGGSPDREGTDSNSTIEENPFEGAYKWDRKSKRCMSWSSYLLAAACIVMVAVLILWGTIGGKDRPWQTAWMIPGFILLLTSVLLMILARKFDDKYHKEFLRIMEEQDKKYLGEKFMEGREN